MTGFTSIGTNTSNYLTPITLGVLEDSGFEVNYNSIHVLSSGIELTLLVDPNENITEPIIELEQSEISDIEMSNMVRIRLKMNGDLTIYFGKGVGNERKLQQIQMVFQIQEDTSGDIIDHEIIFDNFTDEKYSIPDNWLLGTQNINDNSQHIVCNFLRKGNVIYVEEETKYANVMSYNDVN